MRKIILFFVGATLFWLAACRPAPVWHKDRGSIWHTLYSVTYLSDCDLSDSILAEMHRVEMSLSSFCPSSLISAINRGEDLPVDSMLATVFRCSQKVNSLSGGMFDPTVAPLVNYWGFGYADSASLRAPLDSVLARVGMDRCHITPSGHIVRKHPLTEFNFSAITKGFGCDAVAAMLRRNGCTDYLVEIGGEIALGGHPAHGGEWRIMVDAPVDCATAVLHDSLLTLSATDCGIATSGNYRNYRLTDRGKVSHTINPLTGQPATLSPEADTITLSATVIAPTAMEADALATAAMLLPPAAARAMAARAGATRLILAVTTPADSLLVLKF